MISEWFMGIIALLISIIFFIICFSFPQSTIDPGGLSLFPRIICFLLFLSGVLIIISINLRKKLNTNLLEAIKKFYCSWQKRDDNEESSIIRRITFVLILSLFYPLIIQKIGFIIATIIYLFLLTKLYGTSNLKAIIYAFIMGFSIYLVLIKLLKGYIPEGVWIEMFFGYIEDIIMVVGLK